jgi:hypothetical protein
VRRRTYGCAAALLCGVALTSVSSAQRVTSSLDVSGTGVWYADTIRSTGSSLDPAIRFDWSHATIGAFGMLSRLGGSDISAQGTLVPSVFTPSIGPFALELSGSFGGSRHQDGTRTGQLLGITRAYVMAAPAGGWIGGGAGRTWDGATWRNVRQTEAGVWTQRSNLTVLGSVSPIVVDDTLHYTDVQASLRYPQGAFELGLAIGTRSGSVGPAIGGTSRSWGSVSLIAWLTSRLALVGTGGNYPVDLTQGFPGGRFVTLALRIGSRDNRTVESATSSPRQLTAAAEASVNAGIKAFEVRTVRGTQRVLRVNAPNARTIEVSGDFTQWRAIELTRASDGWWSATLPIAAGTYQMNMRIDGGAWLAPPGLMTSTDEFAGVVGILIVE